MGKKGELSQVLIQHGFYIYIYIYSHIKQQTNKLNMIKFNPIKSSIKFKIQTFSLYKQPHQDTKFQNNIQLLKTYFIITKYIDKQQ